MCDCMSDALLRINDRKKYSQRTNDYRVKSIIDYFLKPENPDSPETYLVLKLLGLLPKAKEPRPRKIALLLYLVRPRLQWLFIYRYICL